MARNTLYMALSSLGMAIIKSPGDGHCLIHSFKTSGNSQLPYKRPVDYDTIKSNIFIETLTHCSHYANFLEPVSNFKVMHNLKNYLLSKIFNNRFGDCLPLIIANAFQANIKLYDEHLSGNSFTIHSISPNFTSAIGTLYLCGKGDHFDGIAPQIPVPGRIISGSTITAPCIPVAKEQVSPVMKIPVIWHSRQRQAPIKVHHNHHQLAKLNYSSHGDAHPKQLRACMLNVQSVKNKPIAVNEFITENSLDICVLIETWLRPGEIDNAVIAALCPPGFSFKHIPRANGSGYGGVGLLHRSNINVEVKSSKTSEIRSFELMEVVITSGKVCTYFAIIYRPPPSKRNGFTSSLFFQQFGDLVDSIVIRKESVVILGDLNFHLDNINEPESNRLKDVLFSAGLMQHVVGPTHRSGHTLDVVITGESDNIVKNVTVSNPLISDHSAVHFLLDIAPPPPIRKELVYRKIGDIDIVKWRADITSAFSNIPADLTTCELVSLYDNKLKNILDCHAPEQRRVLTVKSFSPWFNDEIHKEIRIRRATERKWKKSNLTVHKEMFRHQKNRVTNLIASAKCNYYSCKISESGSDPKLLFRTVDNLLNKSKVSPLPTIYPENSVANTFADFFGEKLHKIRAEFASSSSQIEPLDNVSNCVLKQLSSLRRAAIDEVHRIIQQAPPKHCSLDPIPTVLLKKSLDQFLPIITRIINASMSEQSMPSSLKNAFVKPLLKKPSLDQNQLKNYRPVSNLPYVSKLVERVVANRLTQHMSDNNLYEPYQSAYRKSHSVETALIRVQNDILQALDKKQYVILVLLDLASAFDTVDYSILLSRLSKYVGINGDALSWFSSYLSGRHQTVFVNK